MPTPRTPSLRTGGGGDARGVALLGLLAACADPAAPAGQPQDTAGEADTATPAIPVASGPTSGTSPDHDRDGFTADLDCDDDDRDSYPGAPETCGDGVINNCEERPHLGETEDCLLLGPEDAYSSMRLSSIYTTEPGLDVSVVGDVDGMVSGTLGSAAREMVG